MAAKGGNFEREVCKRLSLWWTDGANENVFWRSSQSGGRSTTQAKRGASNRHHCGDICSTDPVGFPLTETFTLELKRGYGKADPVHILDRSAAPRKRNIQLPFEAFLEQAIDAHVRAGTPFWAIIHKRDHWDPMIYFSTKGYSALTESGCPLISNMCSFAVRAVLHGKRRRVCFVGCSLRRFLMTVHPRSVYKVHKEREIWKQF